MIRRIAAAFAGLALLAAAPVGAQTLTIDAEQAGRSVDRLVAGFIRPAFERFAEQAELGAIAVADLCAEPAQRRLDSAREAFRDSVLAFARVEFLRTGPLIADNRLERLLFWPDRRGIALRQVQGAIGGADETVLDPAILPGKSVALQGFTALEYLLFGAGSDALAEPGDAHRCGFAAAVAENIHAVALQLDAEWKDPDGFAAAWSRPGPDNATFRNAEEVVGELLSMPSEAFEIIRDQRLKPVLPEDRAPKPKQALFWRSGASIAFVSAGFEALRTYFEVAGIADLLPEGEEWQAKSIEFEFDNAERTLDRLRMPIAEILSDEDRTADLNYVVILTQSLQNLFGQQLTATLGLSVGFSSLDGD